MMCSEQWPERVCGVRQSAAVGPVDSDTLFYNPVEISDEAVTEFGNPISSLKSEMHMMIKNEIRNYVEEKLKPELRFEFAVLAGLRSAIHTPALVEQQEVSKAGDEQTVQNDVRPKIGAAAVNSEDKPQLLEQDTSVPRLASNEGEGSQSPAHFDSSFRVGLLQHHAGEDLEYVVGNSLWDTFLLYEFEGTNLRIHDAFFLTMALIFGLTLQLGFCVFVHDQFGDGFLGDEEMAGLRTWRYTIGHSWAVASTTTGESLVSQICTGQAEALSSSAFQVQLVQATSKYLGSQGKNVLAPNKSANPMRSPGFILLLMAFMLWEIILLQELRNNWLYACALLAHMRSCPRSFQQSIQHRIIQTIGIICRNAPVVLLYWWGTSFVMMEVELGEMILNCTALVFVLNIDRHLYNVFVPQRAQNVMAQVKPWPLHPVTAAYWRTLASPVFFGLFVTLTLVELHTEMLPMYEKVEDTYMLLCGYDQNFVYSQDAVSLWPRFTDTPLDNDMTLYPPKYLCANITELVERRAHDPSFRLQSPFFQSGPLSVVNSWSVRTMSSWQNLRTCSNADDYMRDVVRIRTIYSEQIENCSQLTADHCSRIPPRLFCPIFCHCHTNSFDQSQRQNLMNSNQSVRIRACCQSMNGTTSWSASCEQKAGQDNLNSLAAFFSTNGISMRYWNACFGGFAGCPSACDGASGNSSVPNSFR